MHVMSSVSPANGSAVAAATSPPSLSRFSNICENELRPPNATPPPPPPPPLPPSPGLRDEAAHLKKKTVRSFFWKPIPEEQVKGHANLWTQGPTVQQHFQINVQEVEELFGQQDCQSNSTAPPTRGGKVRASFREPKQEVSVLDPKRGMHVEIFLKQFKRSNQMLVDDIRHGNSESLGAGPLRELLKLLPGKDEVKKLKACRGSAAKLPLADSFMHLLIQVPSYLVRIESMLLKEELPGSCEVMRRDFNILHSAVKELLCCTELHAVLHLVLQAGNILNAGASAGNAVGFKLSSLLSLADTKSNKPGMNLLHFVALEAQKKDEKLLEFPLKLSDVQAASRISSESLDAELQVLTSRTRSVEESIQKDTELLQQLDGFLQSATSSLCSLRVSQQQLKKEGNKLIDFFCEDRETFRLDDCFCIFHSFCLRFSCAVKENKERKVKEASCHQIQEKELKRRSWAGGEQVHGAVGLRCSSETDMSVVVLKDDSGLLEFLHRSASKNHIPRRRSLNSHRTRISPPTSQLFERERNMFVKLCNDHKVLQQRGKVSSRTASPKSELKATGTSPTKVDSQTTSVSSTTFEDSAFIGKDGVNDHVQMGKLTSSNQQSDHNNENNQLEMSFSSQENLSHLCLNKNSKDKTAAEVVSDVLEVPELNAFEEEIHYCQEDMTKEEVDNSRILNLKDNSKTPCMLQCEKSDVEIIVTRSSPPPRQDCEEEEDKVIVWCVTGVCESAGETAQTEKDQHGGENQRGDQQASSPPPSHMSSEPHLDSETSRSMPISSQPVSRCNNSSLLVSSPGPHPSGPAPASPGPGLTVDGSEEDNISVNQGKRPKKIGHERSDVAPVSSRNKTLSRHVTEKSSKQSTKNLKNAKPQNTLMNPSTQNSTSTSVRSACTTASTENQNMRHVVPITKASRGAKHPEKPSAHNQSSSRATSLPSASIRQGERPSTAPPQESKMPESKQPRNQKVSGVQTATRTQNSDVQRRPSIRKALTKPKTQTEEKMCLLRALTQGERGGSVSAPVTPLHKTKTPSSSAPLGFARNTASSSFRQTKTPLATSHLSNAGSPKTSYKTSSPASRTGSLKVTASLRSTSPLKTSGNIRALLPNSLVPSKDHRENRGLSDKTTHFRDLNKTTRVNWR